MKKAWALLFTILVSTIVLGQEAKKKDELVSFIWKYKDTVLWTVKVPAGFKEETNDYVEGIMTYLRYPDSSYIILQRGGMVKLPFLDDSVHPIIETQRLSNRLVRRGKVKDTDLFWREENSYGLWPPTNIAFDRVPQDRLELFNRSLDSVAFKKRK